jgi:hypothetical protein
MLAPAAAPPAVGDDAPAIVPDVIMATNANRAAIETVRFLMGSLPVPAATVEDHRASRDARSDRGIFVAASSGGR